MAKRYKIILLMVALAVLLALLVFAAVALGSRRDRIDEGPFLGAQNYMRPGDPLTLREQEDGTVKIEWTAGENVDRYRVELRRAVTPVEPNDPAFEVLYSTYVVGDPECTLPVFPRDEELTIFITGETAYRVSGKEKWRESEDPIAITSVFAPPTISDLQWQTDPDEKKLDIGFKMRDDSICQMYTVTDTGDHTLYATLTAPNATVTFGDGMQFPLPAVDGVQRFSFSACDRTAEYIHYGLVTDTISIARNDLLGTRLILECTDLGDNAYAFNWNETRGHTYQIQQLNSDGVTWETLYETDQHGERSYTTGHLPRYSHFTFRVVAIGDEGYSATPDQKSVSTGASVVYSTIWPQKKLDVYDSPQKTKVIGTVEASATYCVLDLEDGMFRIRYAPESYGYIDSNYCLIDLPEMIGDICSYHITNSYASLFKAHGYELPGMTGQLLVGYENVNYQENDFLVPLLYPAALKLEKAALAAIEEGYRLKIYDSFRPQVASQFAYSLAEFLGDQPIPELPFDDAPMEETPELPEGEAPELPEEETPELPEGETPELPEEETPELPEEMPELPEGEVLTYSDLMTDFGRYPLNYFLAKGRSRHNLGVAVDLTLEEISTGEEVKMQTDIHDLSWYSETARNNMYSELLAQIMKNAGFGTLVSEWWHFQDSEAQFALELEYTYNGVSAEGWIKDDTGWRYRKADGDYFKNCTETIEGMSYTFDHDGYVAGP